MKFFVGIALLASSLLTTISSQGHSHPAMPKGLFLPPAHVEHEVKPAFTHADIVGARSAVDSVAALASPFTGPTAHVSTSHPSFGGFHSTPSYHSYSATPSRSFTFRSSSPSVSRPATTSTPRTYTYSISGAPRTKAYAPAPSSPPAEVHHYHSSGGGSGGLSATDIILLNAALNNH